jgi:sugar phosphate isomerase/epimerase
MAVKIKYPFRLGTTSFILPADMLTNVKYLAPKVDDVELLVFESDEMAELPDEGTVRELRRIAASEGLTYTVHLPLDIWLGDFSPKERERSINKCLRTIAGMGVVEPAAWILHCNREGRGNSRIDDDDDWAAVVDDSLALLLKSGVSSRTICIETLDGLFPLLEPMIKNHGLSICLDVGHIVLYQLPFEEYVRKYFDRSAVIHLHGVIEGKDHKNISGVDNAVLAKLFSIIKSSGIRDRVLTLEVFTEKDLVASVNTLKAKRFYL